MFGREVCSDKIAAKAGDAFSDIKAKIGKGIEDIQVGMNTKIGLLAKTEEEAVKLREGIDKDKANIKILQSKSEALDALI